LGGHSFVPSATIPDPFITTFLRSAPGFGLALKSDILIYDTAGNEIARVDGDFTYLLLNFEYQLSLSQVVALHADVDGWARLGTDARSLLAQGIQAVTGFGLGARVRLWGNERSTLTAVADARWSNITATDIIGFAKDIIDGGGVLDTLSLSKSTSSGVFDAGLRYGYGVSPFFGFTVLANGGTAERLDADGREGVFTLGATGSFDFAKISSVPMGLLLGHTYSNYPVDGTLGIESVNTTVFKVAYTGREDFSVGLEVTLRNAPLTANDESIEAMIGFLTLRYFF